MWFFVGFRLPLVLELTLTVVQLMYRAKRDGPALLGLKHPWEH